METSELKRETDGGWGEKERIKGSERGERERERERGRQGEREREREIDVNDDAQDSGTHNPL